MSSNNRMRNYIEETRRQVDVQDGIKFMSIDTVLSGTDPVVVVASCSVGTGITASLPASPANGRTFKIAESGDLSGDQRLVLSGNAPSNFIEGNATIVFDKAYAAAEVVYSSDAGEWLVINLTGSTDFVGSI